MCFYFSYIIVLAVILQNNFFFAHYSLRPLQPAWPVLFRFAATAK